MAIRSWVLGVVFFLSGFKVQMHLPFAGDLTLLLLKILIDFFLFLGFVAIECFGIEADSGLCSGYVSSGGYVGSAS